jgi:hypothetical protein
MPADAAILRFENRWQGASLPYADFASQARAEAVVLPRIALLTGEPRRL